MNLKEFPLTMLELLGKYPQLRAAIKLCDGVAGEGAQKIICDIAELVRQLDFKARKMNEELKECANECYDEGIQQVEMLCAYCQSYLDSIEAEALREYKVSPEYWAWHEKTYGKQDE